MTRACALILAIVAVAAIGTAALDAQQAPPPAPPAPPAIPAPPAVVTGVGTGFSVDAFQEMDGEGGHRFFAIQMHDNAARLAKQLAAAKEEDKKEIREKLTDVVNKEFDAHIRQQQQELEKLEKQIADLRALLKKRQDAKAAIVNRHIDQLVLEAQGLGWNSPHGNAFFWSSTGEGVHIGHAGSGLPVPPRPPRTPPPAKK